VQEALVVAWCIDEDGRKHLLHLAVDNRASEACPSELCRHMVAQGPLSPTLVTSEVAPGLIDAIEAAFSHSVRLRYFLHRTANVWVKLPDDEAGEATAHRYSVRDAPSLDAVRVAADRSREHRARSVPFGRDLLRRGPGGAACDPSGTELLRQ